MNAAATVSAYGAALALLIAGAYVVGTAVGPLTPATADSGDLGETPGAGSAGHGDTHSGTVAEAAGTEPAKPADSGADQPGGLASSRGGYTLTPTDPTPTTGTFSFTITGPAWDAGHRLRRRARQAHAPDRRAPRRVHRAHRGGGRGGRTAGWARRRRTRALMGPLIGKENSKR